MQKIHLSLTLEGDEVFLKSTERALDLIAGAGAEYLDFVREHIGVIRMGERSGIEVAAIPPVFCVGRPTYTASRTWYASAIVHDACHSHLFRIGEPHSGLLAERRCMEMQIRFLRTVAAPKHEIDHLLSLIEQETDYFSDYMKRNW